MREHPNPLPQNEADAVNEARRLFYGAVRRAPDSGITFKGVPFRLDDEPQNFTVPAGLYDLIQQAFQHWPTWDLEGNPIVTIAAYVRGNETREHLLFKGVCMFRGE